MAMAVRALPVSNSTLATPGYHHRPICASSSPFLALKPSIWRGIGTPPGVRSRGSKGSRESRGSRSLTPVCEAKEETKTPPTADASPLVKMAWYGSEAFGKLVAALRPSSGPGEEDYEGEVIVGPVSRSDAAELIRKDYERSYFVTEELLASSRGGAVATGNMNMGIYEPDCEFADPFVSFKGLKRFKQNVSNLGSFMEESSLKITDWQEYEDRVYAKWRFNCVLGLPWRPILAATGSTEYFFDANSGKIRKHVENWDISPADGVRQLFKPNTKRK